MIAALLPILGSIGGQIAKSLFPNPEEETKRQQMETEFSRALVQHSADIEKAAASIINTEAANWRPITMLVFVGLVVARWLGYAAEGMTEAEYLSIYDLIKIGLGGYVVGRSAEKIVPAVMAARKNPG